MRAPLQSELDDNVTQCFETLKDWKSLIDNYFPDEERTAFLGEIQTLALNYCRLEKAQADLRQVIENSGEEEPNVEEAIEELMQSEVTPSDHPIWNELFGAGRANNDVEAVEESGASDTEEATNFVEMGDSVMYSSSSFTPPLDPISKSMVRNPYRNRVCGHVYEHEYIVNYIKSRKTKAKCPYIGCTNQNMRLRAIAEDTELKRKIDDYVHAHGDQSESITQDDDSD